MKDHNNKLEQISKYSQNKMTPEESRRFKKELKTDGELKQMYQFYQKFNEEGRQRQYGRITPALKNLTMQMFKDFHRNRGTADIPNGLIVYDSGFLPRPEGIRASAVDTRRVKYKFDTFELDLAFYPMSLYAYEIVGQISGCEQVGNGIVKMSGDSDSYEAITDKVGLFIFPRAAKGEYALSILLNDMQKGKIKITL